MFGIPPGWRGARLPEDRDGARSRPPQKRCTGPTFPTNPVWNSFINLSAWRRARQKSDAQGCALVFLVFMGYAALHGNGEFGARTRSPVVNRGSRNPPGVIATTCRGSLRQRTVGVRADWEASANRA